MSTSDIYPDGTAESEVHDRETAEARSAANLARGGHLVRLWNLPLAPGGNKILGLYRADSRAQLDGFLAALPLYEWMQVDVTPLAVHPNDPGKDLR